MTIYRFLVRFKYPDPRSAGFLADARALGFAALQRLECQDLYFIEGQLSAGEAQQLALKLLTDPVTQTASWEAQSAEGEPLAVEVAYRPGVTDPVAHEILRAARELGFEGVQHTATGLRFLLDGLDQAQAEKLTRQLLANPVIQHWAMGQISPSFPEETESSGEVEIIPLRDESEAGLLALSQNRRAALDLPEMQAMQAYFRREGRDPTDVEFEMFAQTWSEHCVHKTFKALVEVREERIVNGQNQILVSPLDSIIKTYLKAATDAIAAPWVRSAFVDNAGIVDFDEEFEISFKAETHNHPSAVEPFGGANTGVGGVIRDILGVSAKPIANTDVLCFGPQNLVPAHVPEGVLHPRRIQSGVVAGVQDYGNKIGIPTVNGAILYDEGYTANPLVFCGCVGIAPKGLHHKDPRPGDRIIILGGRTGRDGLRGATFSSMTMDAQTGEVSGASVQIGDPITEKGLIDVITRARDLALYSDITDCGAGGLSSAVGEMTSQRGGEVELKAVRLKYPGLAPWEIWLSEAQERMVLAVPPQNLPALQTLCDTFNTELTDIGAVTDTGRIRITYGGETVLDLENEFLHNGIPQRRLVAALPAAEQETNGQKMRQEEQTLTPAVFASQLYALLSSPNIASKAPVIRLYDHEVQGACAVKPLTGIEMDAPSDAAVLKPMGVRGSRGIVLSNGINPEYGKRDSYKMAWAVIDEAIRNAVAVGADPQRIALLDNFCWGDPTRPETMGSLVQAARGCYDAALFFQAPFISGKDSLNNEYLGADGLRHSIPPTLLISALGMVEDVSAAVTMDFKAPGSDLYIVGDFQPLFGGSQLAKLRPDWNLGADPLPSLSPHTPQVYRALHQAIRAGLVLAAHDLSEGGLAVTAAEMCIGGRMGAALKFGERDEALRVLFGETTGCLLVEVAPQHRRAFLDFFADLPFTWVGKTASHPHLDVTLYGAPVLHASLDEILQAFAPPSP